MVETEFAAVLIVLLVSFRCFDGSASFVPVFQWFRPFRWFLYQITKLACMVLGKE